MMSGDEFELAYRRVQDEGGHSYDNWDIAVSWDDYERSPNDHWLSKLVPNNVKGT